MLTDGTKNAMLDILDETGGTPITHFSLHTAYSPTGANEVAGGSYARQAAAFGAAASGQKASTGSPAAAFPVPAGTTVAWVGFWSALTGGTFRGMSPLGAGQLRIATVDDAGTDVVDSPAHGYSNGDQIVAWAINAGGLPGGISEGTIYHVRDVTTDTFKLATTAGGAAMDITSVGKALVQKIVPEAFAGAGTYNLDSVTLSLASVL